MTPCIEHTQKGNAKGYGHTRRVVNGKPRGMNLHRAVFFDHNGYWPDQTRHLCNNGRCINPEHLADGSVIDNAADRLAAGNYATGEAHHNSVLSNQARHDIAVAMQMGLSGRDLAAQCGVSRMAIKGCRGYE